MSQPVSDNEVQQVVRHLREQVTTELEFYQRDPRLDALTADVLMRLYKEVKRLRLHEARDRKPGEDDAYDGFMLGV